MSYAHPTRVSTVVMLGLLAILPGLADAAVADPPHAQVLALYSTRRDAQIAVVGDTELPRMFGAATGDLDYYAEYLDLARFSQPDYQAAVREFLRQKYGHMRFDLIVAVDDLVVDFVTANRADLFPGVPMVFVSNNTRRVRPANATGIIVPYDLSRSVTMAGVMQPDVRRVVVVTGADHVDVGFERQAREEFAALVDRFEFTYLTALPTPELERRLALLDNDTIVFYLLVNRDGSGRVFHPLDYVTRVAAAAAVPVYSWVDSAMGRGIVGGSLKNQAKQMAAIGALGRRVLDGERADDIAVTRPDVRDPIVDWRQLRRWGISERRLPAGTVVRFRELSFWDRYKAYVIGTAGLVLVQSILIGGLLVQRRHRRRAEADVRGREKELRRSYVHIRHLMGRLLGAQDSERARIARELHDDLSQQLARLCNDLELLSGLVDEGGDVAHDALDRAHTIARSVRDLSHRLHPAMLRITGLGSSLQTLKAEMSRPGLDVCVEQETPLSALPPDVTLSVYRVAQEALSNAARHSRARLVQVRIGERAGTLVMTITDDGSGFVPQPGVDHGLGLVSMRERIESIGGRFAVHSTAGAGTRIEVSVPMPTSATDTESRRA